MKQKQQIRKIQGEQGSLEYTLTRKRVKNINMRIKPDGQILVSANVFVPVKYIDNFVLSQEEKLVKILAKYEKMQKNRIQPLQYVSGEKVRLLGEELHLLLEETKVEGVDKFGKFLILRVKDISDFARKEKVMKKWLRKLQWEVFEEVCKELYPLLKPYDVKYPLIKIRDMKSRWGSCQPQKRIITLNGKMIFGPKEAIEYVVLHELVHFIHPNHSKEFYAFVENLMPDWKERKALLPNIE